MFKRMMVVGAVASALVFAGCRDQSGSQYDRPTDQTQGTGGGGTAAPAEGTGGAGQGTGDIGSSESVGSDAQPGAIQGTGEGSSDTQGGMVPPDSTDTQSDVGSGDNTQR